MEGLFLTSCTSLFLRIGCFAAKALSERGSSWVGVGSAAEISLANEGVCGALRNKNNRVFSVRLSCFVHLVILPVLQHPLSAYLAFITSSWHVGGGTETCT